MKQSKLGRLSISLVGAGALTLMAILPFGSATGATHPLDPYPGFGRSEPAALRDDAIALWEAYRRDVTVADCMAQADFEFMPEVAFPAQPILAVADYLDVSFVPLPSAVDPEEWNAEYRAGLSATELDAYYQTYVGESAADVASAEANHGEPPIGSDPETFARGGCVADAIAAIGSIWDANHDLEAEFDQMDAEIAASTTIAEARVEFSACMVTNAGVPADGPGEAEELIAAIVDDGGVGDPDAIVAALDECNSIWEEAYGAADADAAAAFVDRNQGILVAQQDRYEGAETLMQEDSGFNEWLRIAAGAVAFDQAVSGDGSHPPVDIDA